MATETKTFTFKQKISWALAIAATLILLFLIIAFSNGVYKNVLFPLSVTAFGSAFVSILLYRRNILGWTIFVVIIILIMLAMVMLITNNKGL